MKTSEELVRKNLEQQTADHPLGIEYAAGVKAGLKKALDILEKLPDWEEVCERLMDALTIYGEIFDSMPSSIEDMIGDDEKNTRVDEAFEAYKSAHFQMTSE